MPVYISEYSVLARDIKGVPLNDPQEPSMAEQTVAVGAGSVQSSAFNAETRFIRVHTDVICSIAIGANPTAAATAKRMDAGQTEYFGVFPGHRLAAIINT